LTGTKAPTDFDGSSGIMRLQVFHAKSVLNQFANNSWASATKSYHNGGVEGHAFSNWYDTRLAKFFSNGDGWNNHGSGGTKGHGSGGTKGHGSGGTKGHGSGGTKGHGSDGTKGHGSGGTKGSGSGCTKGSGSGGTKGHGSDGTKGHGSDGTKGSGSGGTKGHGSDGTKGSGSDGTKGHGSGGTGGSGGTVRESFEWDLAPDPNDAGAIDNFDDISNGFTQNTGHVNVSFSVLGTSAGAQSEFYTADQLTDGILDDGAPVDGNSAMSSFLNSPEGEGQFANYQLEFSEAVSNVSFRINDIDTDALVRVLAYDTDGNQIEIGLTAGSAVDLSDSDTISGNDLADSTGPDGPSNSPDASVLVDIAGPVSRIVIEHSQDGPNNTGIDVTDIYFDVGTDAEGSGTGGSGTGGSGTGGCGSASYHNGGIEGHALDGWYDDHLSGRFDGSGTDAADDAEAAGSGTAGSGDGDDSGNGWDAPVGVPPYTGEPLDADADDGSLATAGRTGGSGGTSGSGASGSGPSLEDILGLMTVVPDDDDPSLIDPDDLVDDDIDEMV
jgi:hypothetical protein